MDSRTDAMARRVQQRLSVVQVPILFRTVEVGRKASHGGNNSKSIRDYNTLTCYTVRTVSK